MVAVVVVGAGRCFVAVASRCVVAGRCVVVVVVAAGRAAAAKRDETRTLRTICIISCPTLQLLHGCMCDCDGCLARR